MTSEKKCCVPNCNSEKEILHKFPNPEKQPERFQNWLHNIGGDILTMENSAIFRKRKVCHLHFEVRDHTWSKYLSPNAVPRLNLPGCLILSGPLADVSNREDITNTPAAIFPLQGPSSHVEPISVNLNKEVAKISTTSTKKIISSLKQEIKLLKKKNISLQKRLKKAQNLETNISFQTAIKKFNKLAAIFTIMQFREAGKPQMGRRFTEEEKVMALSIYKLGPRAYRYLNKIFILPSLVTIGRILSKARLRPGINENIFN